MNCSKCSGSLELIQRKGQAVFLFCRPCKLPHDESGNALFTAKSLAERYNPLSSAREVIRRHHPGASPVAKTALEVALIQQLQEAYFSGIKDGVLLAYSQDIEEGEPMAMEKMGVSDEELKAELRAKYNDLKGRERQPLTKEASAMIQREIEAVKAKLDQLEQQG